MEEKDDLLVVTTLARALLRRGGRLCGRRRRRIWQRPDFSVSQVFPHTAHCTAGWMVCTGIYTGVGMIGRELEEEGVVVRAW